MGMKVKVGRRRRIRVTVKAFAYPGLAAQRAQAFGVAGAGFAVLGFMIASIHATTLYVGVGILVWLVFSWAVAWFAASASDRGKVKRAGTAARVWANNFPEIKALVAEHCREVGIREPTTYVLDEEFGRVTVLGGGKPVLIISAKMTEVLSPAEFRSALIRALAEVRIKAPGPKGVIAFMGDASPLLRFCLLPAHVLAVLLDHRWRLMADLTADRALLIATRRPRECLATIIKLAIEANPWAQLDHADVETYLRQGGGMQTTTVGVSTHFKMGTGLKEIPGLSDRLQELIEYAGSERYQELCRRIDEARNLAKPPAARPDPRG